MLSPHSQTPPSTTPSPSPPPMSVCPPWILIPPPSLTFPCSSGCPLNARLLKSPTVHMMAFHLRPKTLMPGASPVKLVATLFHTRTNVPVHLPSNIGMLTSSDGSPYFSSLSYPAHPSFLLSSPAASSASPAPEPSKPQVRPSGAPTELKAGSNSNTAPGPPSKRRRAKRSEEERIQYLRSDPYVAQFDAYRVLCASCDKWIRLRPNSTFCSIPWDAHRKSCLARKGCVVISPTLRIPFSCILNIPLSLIPTYSTKEPAPAFVAADPDARKYDGARVLCKACNSWIFVGQDSQAAQAWSQHRAKCRPASPSVSPAAPTVPRSALLSLSPFATGCYLQ